MTCVTILKGVMKADSLVGAHVGAGSRVHMAGEVPREGSTKFQVSRSSSWIGGYRPGVNVVIPGLVRLVLWHCEELLFWRTR